MRGRGLQSTEPGLSNAEPRAELVRLMQRHSTTGYLLDHIEEESELKGHVPQILNALEEDVVVSAAVSVIVLVDVSSGAIRVDGKNRKSAKRRCELQMSKRGGDIERYVTQLTKSPLIEMLPSTLL
jgi:hypothetical protein